MRKVLIKISNILLFYSPGSIPILQQEPVKVLYPKISSPETIDCDCGNMACDNVYWFRIVPEHNKVEYLAKCNNADRVTYGPTNQTRFKFSKRGSASFILRIPQVTEADAGIYSCVLADTRSKEEKFIPGTLLRPGGLYGHRSLTGVTYQAFGDSSLIGIEVATVI